MKYHRHLNYRKRRRFIIKLRLFFACLFLSILAGSAYGYLWVTNGMNDGQQVAVASQPTTRVIESTNKVFTKPAYQFQTDKTWYEVPNESSSNKHVYRSRRANLIEHELVIYVNQAPNDLAATRVLPVKLANDGSLEAGTVSDHCVKAAGGSRIDKPQITMSQTGFRCLADASVYSVLVGMVGGNSVISPKKPDGSAATNFSILYTNVKAVPDAAQLENIIGSFRAR